MKLLISDIDLTLVNLRDTQHSRVAAARFRDAIAGQRGLHLAYATGRSYDTSQEVVRELGLPSPHYFICDVGASVYNQAGLDLEHRRRLSMLPLGELQARMVGLERVRHWGRGRLKQTYLFPFDEDEGAVRVRARLRLAGLPCEIVIHKDIVHRRGCLDVLARGANKGNAVRYLRDALGLTNQDVMFSGDGGNDVDALVSGVRAVVVGNASAAVKDVVEAEARTHGLPVYFAVAHLAQGVLEGARYHGFVSSEPGDDGVLAPNECRDSEMEDAGTEGRADRPAPVGGGHGDAG